MPGCYPYGVRAMWSERSRHMRGGVVLGSSGKVAGLAVRFLARDMRLTGAKAAGVPAALAPVSLMSRARIHTAAPPNWVRGVRLAFGVCDRSYGTPYGFTFVWLMALSLRAFVRLVLLSAFSGLVG